MSENTEELIPLLLPDDEEGYSWSLRNNLIIWIKD